MMLLLLAGNLAKQILYTDIVMEIVQPKQQDRCPEAGNLVVTRYSVQYVNGTLVNRSNKPYRFTLGGGSAPYNLDYIVGQMCVGERVRAQVDHRNETLVVDVELVDFK